MQHSILFSALLAMFSVWSMDRTTFTIPNTLPRYRFAIRSRREPVYIQQCKNMSTDDCCYSIFVHTPRVQRLPGPILLHAQSMEAMIYREDEDATMIKFGCVSQIGHLEDIITLDWLLRCERPRTVTFHEVVITRYGANTTVVTALCQIPQESKDKQPEEPERSGDKPQDPDYVTMKRSAVLHVHVSRWSQI